MSPHDLSGPPQQQQVVRKDQSLKHRVKRVQTTKNLFWFSKPTVFIMLYKMAYFQVGREGSQGLLAGGWGLTHGGGGDGKGTARVRVGFFWNTPAFHNVGFTAIVRGALESGFMAKQSSMSRVLSIYNHGLEYAVYWSQLT